MPINISPLFCLPKKTWLLLGLLAFLAILLIFISQLVRPASLEVIRVFPAAGEEEVDFILLQIKIDFNQTLESPDSVQVKITPKIESSFRLSQNHQALIIEPQKMLLPSTEYTIEVVLVKTGNALFSSSFKTMSLELEETGGRGDPGLVKKIHQKDQEDFPLLPWVPFSTQDFEADYLAPLKLEVKIKTNPDLAKEAVEAWIKSHKVDPGTHEIIYLTP